MAKQNDIFKYICDGITPPKRSIERHHDVFGEYYEQTENNIEKTFDENFTEFNHVAIEGTIKKGYNPTHNTIPQKRNSILIIIIKKLKQTKKFFINLGSLDI